MTAVNGTDIRGEAQGVRRDERTGKGAVDTVLRLVKVVSPEETQDDVSAHEFCKRGTTAMFDIRIVNI